MNKTGNKQLVFEPFIKLEKNGSKSIQTPDKLTILGYIYSSWDRPIFIAGNLSNIHTVIFVIKS